MSAEPLVATHQFELVFCKRRYPFACDRKLKFWAVDEEEQVACANTKDAEVAELCSVIQSWLVVLMIGELVTGLTARGCDTAIVANAGAFSDWQAPLGMMVKSAPATLIVARLRV